MFHQIDITIYGSTIRVQSKDASSLDVLQTEFRHFLSADKVAPNFLLTLHAMAAPTGLLPTLTANRISQNSISYDEGPRRWNDYFGKALTCYDYEANEGVVYTADKHLMHEVAYLMVLSLTAKDLDQRNWHKVHACAFRYKGKDAVVMLPSKGGKTTLFLELTKIPGVLLLSDDTPLIDHQGNVHPFPLRLGVDELPLHLKDRENEFAKFHRQHFSDKWLIPLDKLGCPIAQGPSSQVLLFQGQRRNERTPHIELISMLAMYRALLEHMVVGIGLPMVIEYFVRHTWRDWGTLLKIAFKRNWAAFKLLQKSKNYVFVMGNDPALNAQALINKMDQQ